MSIQGLLQQLLQSGQSLAQDAGSKLNTSGQGLGSTLGGFGGGALAGGALGMLLGNKKFRKIGGKIGAYGGAAALGAVALKAYQDWQDKNAALPSAADGSAPPQTQPRQLQAVAALPLPEIELQSRVILSAMIAAAKADGHIGAEEKQIIDAEVVKLTNDSADALWFESEMEKPANPMEIAALATTPELGAEIYLASKLVIDEESFMERAYLDELARNLKLEPGLKAELDSKLKSLAG
ncbi:tellurite resistance TerB family protein [Candidimonas sp. SYP-B2681]|uniref:tellurite resistance TerB family protein n=1 Tax=Candidimonas sp. SYP-B2681 TaxID=2497686 RepID=UPI000F881E45|nr:tellurite resistance TerB family protein [Candidimonas sp. SYP-B2681]RTZ45561.1 tellurite resistance TerB family protein [Candidimonas sp. SYP-B2681]